MDLDTIGSWTATESYGRYECQQHGASLEYAFTRLSRIIFLLPRCPGLWISWISFDVYAAETPAAVARFPICTDPSTLTIWNQ